MGSLGKKTIMSNKGEIFKLLVQRCSLDDVRGLAVETDIDLAETAADLNELCKHGPDADNISSWLKEAYEISPLPKVERLHAFSSLVAVPGGNIQDMLDQVRISDDFEIKFIGNDMKERVCYSSFSFASWIKLGDFVYFEVGHSLVLIFGPGSHHVRGSRINFENWRHGRGTRH